MERLCIYMYSLIYLMTYLNQTASYILKHSNELQAITSCFPNILPPLNSCSTDSSVVGYRTICMNNGRGCPQGTLYLCGLDITQRFIIEACQANVQCPPGTTHSFVVNQVNQVNVTVELQCLPCDAGMFEPDFSNSSRSHRLHGCSYQHRLSENVSHNLVLFEEGTSYRATRWYCDIHNGFHEENGHMFCDDVPTNPCRCVQKTCPKGRLLRPDGQCIRCTGKLDRKKGFVCVRENSDDSLPHQNNNAKSTAIWYHLPKKGDSRKEGNSQQKDFENNRNDAVPNLLTTVTNTEKEENAGTDRSNRDVILAAVGTCMVVIVAASLGFLLWRYWYCSWNQMTAAARFVFNVVVGRSNRSRRTGSSAGHDVSGEPRDDNNPADQGFSGRNCVQYALSRKNYVIVIA